MTTDQDERYVKALEGISAALRGQLTLQEAYRNEEPPEMFVPTSQKISEIEQLAFSVSRLKELKLTNPALAPLIEQALTKEGLSLETPDVLISVKK